MKSRKRSPPGLAEINHKSVPVLRKESPVDKHTKKFEDLSSRKKEQRWWWWQGV